MDLTKTSWIVVVLLSCGHLLAATNEQYAAAAIAIAQSAIDLGKQQPSLPDHPPNAGPPETQGLASDTGLTDEAGLSSTTAFAKPLAGSCIVRILDGMGGGGIGSGTVVSSDAKGSDILTCEHIGRNVENPKPMIEMDGKSYPATVIRSSAKVDLALYHIEAVFLPVELAKAVPAINSVVVSIDLNSFYQSKLLRLESQYDPERIVTDCRELEGRSGGGLFSGTQLIGVVHTRAISFDESYYVSLSEIQKFLAAPLPPRAMPVVDPPHALIPVPEAIADNSGMRLVIMPPSQGVPTKAGRYLVTAYSGVNCRYCKQDHDRLKDGNDYVVIDWTDDSLPIWIQKKLPRGSTYPIYVWQLEGTNKYQWFENSRGITLEQLQKVCRDSNASQENSNNYAASGPAGAIHASAKIGQAFDYFRQYVGEGNRASMTWDRNGAESISLLSKTDWNFKSMFGTDGRIELDAPSAINLPVKSFAFGYLCRGSDVTFDAEPVILKGLADRLKIDGRSQSFGSRPQPVGLIGIDDLLLADSIFNLFKDVFSLLWPSVDCRLPEQIIANAILNGDTLTITFDKAPMISIQMLFHFSLTVKSVVITEKLVTVNFSGSRWITSRQFAVQ